MISLNCDESVRMRLKLQLIIAFALLIGTGNCAYTQDCSNLEGVSIVNIDSESVCFNSFSFTVEIDLFSNPIGEEFDYIVTNSGSGSCIAFQNDSGLDFIPQHNVSVLFDSPGCDPIVKDLFLEVQCKETGETLFENIFVSTITIYPLLAVNVVLPGCNPGETGSAVLVNTVTGEICSETILGVPGVAGVCDGIDATLDFDLSSFVGTPCEAINNPNLVVDCNTGEFGCMNSIACNYNPNAVCDDGSCFTQDVCCPNPITSSFPSFICGGDDEICIEFDGEVASSIELVYLIDENQETFLEIISQEGNTVCLSVENGNMTCDLLSTELTLVYRCFEDPPGATTIAIGTVILYPNEVNFIPQFETYAYEECTDPPELIEPSNCFVNVTTTFIEPDNCRAEDGLFIWQANPLFNITGAEECFSSLKDSIIIAPCPSIPSNGTLSIKKN